MLRKFLELEDHEDNESSMKMLSPNDEEFINENSVKMLDLLEVVSFYSNKIKKYRQI